MGQFNNKIMAEFNPPRKWTLGRDLSYTTSELTVDDIKALKGVGVKVHRETNKTETITVPTGFVTDLASVPRACWAFIAPFDVARPAVIHDILYERINARRPFLTKKEFAEMRKLADNVFLQGMNATAPLVASWKKYSAYYAVRLFGRFAIKSSAPRTW